MTDTTQTRFYCRASRADATRLFVLLETEFEDDGFPLAIREINEEADIDEVELYADGNLDVVEDRITRILGDTILSDPLTREKLPDTDWVAASLEGLKPVRAGRFFVHGSHDRAKRRIGDLPIEIEAGLAFGTGHHGTTSGCLDMIWRVAGRERPRNALDLGTGSAVLAIGLAKMARIPVLATDIDPVATKVAVANVRLNHAGAFVETKTATGFHHPVFAKWAPFDMIVANILARPLMRLAPEMATYLTPGGSLILSGILERQRNAVLAAYNGQKFRHVATLAREGWVTLHLKR
ncbi:50S ribosomal protein L11 methyltransferase [Mesorhizobium sp. NBSH29]|uniref:50S ribosomal protein L11 methyltransferase n=1 Tax=Mesorhizobium sp. NBSH29 TaxID=2654249 RepID=UPI0018968C92|nr:50S ribosomal protein L11 methyltransferase [Mesorhizobium sp. NBSH29]QPC88187.1 50S ribosomal protein L11 methyltransferase [Mesorhizobium sp. NBSH29]